MSDELWDAWQPIASHHCHSAVLVGRPSDNLIYTPTSAFLDVTGVWRIFRSEGGMTPLPFEPTHWMPLPEPPKVGSGNQATKEQAVSTSRSAAKESSASNSDHSHSDASLAQLTAQKK